MILVVSKVMSKNPFAVVHQIRMLLQLLGQPIVDPLEPVIKSKLSVSEDTCV